MIFVFGILSACNDDEPEITEPGGDVPVVADTLYWEMPHTRFLGMRGQIKSCVECGLDDEGAEAERKTMEFDTCGHLLWYDPVGLSVEGEERISAYEFGWIDPVTYRYKYNEAGQLVTAILETMGSEPEEYHLEYGNHGRYVPLPFPLGSLSFFLVRDLVKVSKGDGWEYVFDGTKAWASTNSWTGTTKTEYDFDGIYPSRRLEVTCRSTDTVKIEITNYVFGEKGCLKSISVNSCYPADDNENRTDIKYTSQFLLKPLTETILFSDDKSTRYEYSYDSSGNMLVKAYVRRANGNEVSGREETNAYSGPDNLGNWTKRECVIPGMGTLLYNRTIEYYKN